jgi:phosphatidate cytidylyltransferase
MLHWRLFLGALIIATLVALCWLDAHAATPGVWLLPVAFVATVLATRELLDLLAAGGMRPIRWVVHLGNLLLVVSAWLPYGEWSFDLHFAGVDLDGLLFLLITSPVMIAGALLFAVFIAEMCRYHKPSGATANIAGAILAFLYIGMMLRCAVSLRTVWGVGALASWIIAVKMGDTGAYAAGRFFGRHKLAPLISPGKTIEGAVGALLFSCLGSWSAFRWLVPASVADGPWWGWLTFGLLVGAAGIVGDLAESLLKRDTGRKDSSDWLPGFGGVLDMLDSLLLSAPVAWLCWASGMVGR